MERSPEEVAREIRDGDLLAISGNGEMLLPDSILEAIERRFLETGSPHSLDLVYTVFPGGKRPGTGIERFIHPGMVRRVYAGSYYSLRASGLNTLVADGSIEAYLLPYGHLHAMLRAGANDEPGALLRTGIDTFVDPRATGGRLTKRTPPLLRLVEVNGEEVVFAPALRPDVAILRGSFATESGDVSLRHEPGSLGVRAMALAARASRGLVLVQVERHVRDGSLHPREVELPRSLVDRIIVAPDQMKHFPFRPELTGDAVPLRLPVVEEPAHRALVVERASRELRPGDLANVGMGLPASVPSVARSRGRDSRVLFNTEHGPIGGVPNDRENFGPASDPRSIFDSSRMFEMFAQGRLDVSFLGMGEVDQAGNVNVANIDGRVNMGGFLDIVHSTKRIVFCGNLRTKGLRVRRDDAHVRIESEGAVPKFVARVAHCTFNADRARRRGQEVVYVTERAVLALTPTGIRLVEVPPGIDVQRDVLDQMEFEPEGWQAAAVREF